MEYSFKDIEQYWQHYWAANKTFATSGDRNKPKYYVLDMFPYPSGSGLHVGHPLGYIASDIVARYKRITGFNVLHPMGYDSFGLPAEQYAIQTGQHPSITTSTNINRYREQLDKIGFSYDWDREIKTSDPKYYKWTQWIFIQLYTSWYNIRKDKAEKITSLISLFEESGNQNIKAVTDDQEIFSAEEWQTFNEKRKEEKLMQYRLAYLSETMVNWCSGLGTVLANEEVKDGLSERGGFPVERKLMPQWSLRITAYAERLLHGLEKIDWSESLKEAQRNWIGKSEGSGLTFKVADYDLTVEVFTTRPDTIFGATFLTLSPEHELVPLITSDPLKEEINQYIKTTKTRSERERMAEVKKITGKFTGAYAIHPFTDEKIEIWIGDYVLAGYGTGAVMAVPAHDERDHAFALHFNLPIKPVIQPADEKIYPGQTLEQFIQGESYDAKTGTLVNSDFLNGLEVAEAVKKIIQEIEKRGLGKGKTNYRLRDAIFGRQRYWGEPIPVYYKNGIPYTLNESDLPLELPPVDKYLPTEMGEPPLARASTTWKKDGLYPYEHTTMPGWAGSSWYFLRYMDPGNEKVFASSEALHYWKEIDLYIGGSEHATGHLLYVRFWTKFLYDLGYLQQDEPAKKLINQGMIQGISSLVYRVNNSNHFVSHGLKDNFTTTALHIDISLVQNNILNIEGLKNWREEFKTATFELEDGKYICGSEVEKMSKRWHNVVNPDDICNEYGADCLRLYEMFLGPLEQSKPWNTNGITGVYNFLKKFWRLFFKNGVFTLVEEEANKAELKILHKTIKKIKDDIERFSFNTSVSAFMICINELSELKCNKKSILEPLLILLSPFAPHLTEELWKRAGYKKSITFATFPLFNETCITEDSFEYPVSINGKTRFKINLSLQFTNDQIIKEVLSGEEIQKWLQGNEPKKVIVVPGRIVNVVL